MKDKEISRVIDDSPSVVNVTIIPSYIYDHMISKWVCLSSLFTYYLLHLNIDIIIVAKYATFIEDSQWCEVEIVGLFLFSCLYLTHVNSGIFLMYHLPIEYLVMGFTHYFPTIFPVESLQV